MKQTWENVRVREEAAARCTKVIKRRVLKKQARKARTDHVVNCMSMGTSRKTEKNGKRSCRDTVKGCVLIPKKQKKCKRKELNI